MAKAYLVAGLMYGDEGKGSIVDYISDLVGADSVVRYNGGCQAAHHVVNGVTHCFSQFSSGTFAGSRTHLSEYMLVDLLALDAESDALKEKGVKDPYAQLTVHPESVIITPMQKIVGQMREIRENHSSCGMGVGETARDTAHLRQYALRAEDLFDHQILSDKLDYIQRVKLDHAEQLVDTIPDATSAQDRLRLYDHYEKISDRGFVEQVIQAYFQISPKLNLERSIQGDNIVFEGAQGVLLHRNHGFIPFVTKSDTTYANAFRLLQPGDEAVKIGVMRSYATRHGNGPFVTEDDSLGFAELHNKHNEWQGDFRIGHMDLVAAKYALDIIGGIDCLALTHMEKAAYGLNVCTAYEYRGNEDISGLFEAKSICGMTIIRSIKPQAELQEQAQFAGILKDCIPAVWKSFSDADTMISFMEEYLGVPVAIASFGPKRSDKMLVHNVLPG